MEPRVTVESRMDRQVVAYVDPSVKLDLEAAAARDSRSLSNYVALVLTEHVKANQEG